MNYSDLVFRGTISDIKKSTVYFQVARVWKGNVTKVFTMADFSETSACVGFWPAHLRIGNDLLVYAKWLESRDSGTKGAYFTNICTRTRFTKDAGEGFSELGPSSPPPDLRQSHFAGLSLLGLAVLGVGAWLLFRQSHRRSVA